MESWRMEFNGKLLKRGFWLYIWDIKEDRRRHLYVGRTGDSSSPNASSPFRRIGQHLDSSLNAKGNALGRQLKTAGIDPENCTFEMTAVGPIFEEQETMSEHRPKRDQTAALERALADELKRRGYNVLGHIHAPRNLTEPCWSKSYQSCKFLFLRKRKIPFERAISNRFSYAKGPPPLLKSCFVIERGSKSFTSSTPVDS